MMDRRKLTPEELLVRFKQERQTRKLQQQQLHEYENEIREKDKIITRLREFIALQLGSEALEAFDDDRDFRPIPCTDPQPEATAALSVSESERSMTKQTVDKDEQPSYTVIRNKSERAKLTGTSCKCCKEFHEAVGTLPCPNGSGSHYTAEDRIQQFSRHREKYKRPKTPPGFWDTTIPATPEFDRNAPSGQKRLRESDSP